MTAPTEIAPIKIASREVVIVSPYERITKELTRMLTSYAPGTTVRVISELNGVIHVGPKSIDFGQNHESLRSVDFKGSRWDYKKEPDFGKYVEGQLREVSDAMVGEMMSGRDPSLVIDLEQLLGVRGDVLFVYNIPGFSRWCLQHRVPIITVSAEVKASLIERMKCDPFQGDYTETVYLTKDEIRSAEQDFRMVLSGDQRRSLDSKGVLDFHPNA